MHSYTHCTRFLSYEVSLPVFVSQLEISHMGCTAKNSPYMEELETYKLKMAQCQIIQQSCITPPSGSSVPTFSSCRNGVHMLLLLKYHIEISIGHPHIL